jgi:tetratricopeptide (TPR) repeat protein
MGRYAEAERTIKKAVESEQTGKIDVLRTQEGVGIVDPRDLYLAIGMQGRYREAVDLLTHTIERLQTKGEDVAGGLGFALGFLGMIALKNGDLDKAQYSFAEALDTAPVRDYGQQASWNYWLGLCDLTQDRWEDAVKRFSESLAEELSSYNYFRCAALIGLAYATATQGHYSPVSSLLFEAEELAQRYEFNDHLASLRLIQGHIVWGGHLAAWGTGFDAALAQYQQALIYALRYNRFLLDEVLWGGDVCTPLDPIIPHCLERGAEGRQMLIALRDWWQTGRNDVGQPRPDTISPIPEGISLLEAEQIARRREPGDGSPQQTVVEKIEQALTTYSSN